jgi:hypothetical protein
MDFTLILAILTPYIVKIIYGCLSFLMFTTSGILLRKNIKNFFIGIRNFIKRIFTRKKKNTIGIRFVVGPVVEKKNK